MRMRMELIDIFIIAGPMHSCPVCKLSNQFPFVSVKPKSPDP
jgi:hypothetical protein